MLRVANIYCGYKGKNVVKNVSFQLKKGEKACIIGPNGSGKSTLLKGIVGLIAYEGSVQIDGVDVKKLKRKETASKIGFLNQMNKVYFSYTVYETVLLGRYAKTKAGILSAGNKEDREYVERSLAAVDIQHLRDRQITQLSGGELQRVFLAKVFAQEPELIILDEPTNHLDLRYQMEIMDYMDTWCREKDGTVLAVLHDINLAVSFADRILLMDEGSLVAYEDKNSIMEGSKLNQVYGIDVKDYMQKSFKQWNKTISAH